MDRYQSVDLGRHMEAANADSSQLLQQIIYYDKKKNRAFSISWRYSAQINEDIHYPRLRLPFVFDTRCLSDDPWQLPHVFFFKSIVESARIELLSITCEDHCVIYDLVQEVAITLPTLSRRFGSSLLVRDSIW
uniref:Uncharacterized protein n=1 Tax=Nelumbo nucifera TaxID=4432 RepID=A0A822XSV6_NELNU|nr:TPA_asm: hypothetical protein HUJ06_026158 [Nelumbo nucifera]